MNLLYFVEKDAQGSIFRHNLQLLRQNYVFTAENVAKDGFY